MLLRCPKFIMNPKIIIHTRKLIGVVCGLTLALTAFGSDFDQGEKTEKSRERMPEITEEKNQSDNDPAEMSLLEAIERAGGLDGLKREPLRLDERPVPSRFPTDGSTLLAASFGDQPNSVKKTRERAA